MPRLTLNQRLNLLAAKIAARQHRATTSISTRWALPNWDLEFPWWRAPATIRILIYADGEITFTDNLTHITTLLRSRPLFNVEFKVTTAHRTLNDPGASVSGPKPLSDTELDILHNFEEIWFFGFNDDPDLSKTEVELLDTFMAAPLHGGVLVTGDHENRGKSIASQIARAGKMRLYPSPCDDRPKWNNSLEEGPDPNEAYDFNDQSDDVPQKISNELFPVTSLTGFKQFSRPHPVLCGINGPIDVLPDHQHEGQAAAPIIANPDAEWPAAGDHLEQPVIIARGKTKEPKTGVREFDVLSAYDGHNVNLGRIVADSSWHHWFDVNLTGIPGNDIYRGFEVSADGREALRKIENYFLNCGVWLAPPAKQREMRNAAWWSILGTHEIAELSPDVPLPQLGEHALSALMTFASPWAASAWVFGPTEFKSLVAEVGATGAPQELSALNISLEQYLAGGILKSLMKKLGPLNPATALGIEGITDSDVEGLINDGLRDALLTLK
jgi:hypothetical protein